MITGVRSPRADLLEDLVAVQAGQHDVENRHVVAELSCGPQTTDSVVDDIDYEALAGEPAALDSAKPFSSSTISTRIGFSLCYTFLLRLRRP
jgi:hypothetical protein